MIVLIKGQGRIFIPDSEARQIPGLLADGYQYWQKTLPVQVDAGFDPTEHREEIASEPDPVAVADVTLDNAPSLSVDWTAVRGVSTEIADALLYMGLDSRDAFLSFFMAGGIEAVTKIQGVGMKRARNLIAYAQKG